MDVHAARDAEIYAKYSDALIRFATGLVGPSDAPDVVSEAVVRAMTHRTWPHVTHHRAYLYRAVMNEAKMHHRSTMRRRARELRDFHPTTDEIPEVRPDVLDAVGALSTRQKASVFLTYWEGLTPDEVGTRLGISEGSVKRHLARARAKLRGVLDE
ncbi:MAG: sigma-70 family RNA polymerase sigma factor [Acidimicrobiia bacterium]|nr:sigma-70 family RNA polymerase sigma factor [Acidimicrobiia bacterium]